MGMSSLAGIEKSSTIEYNANLYYGLGLFYQLPFGESKWGLNMALDFNKRGYEQKRVSIIIPPFTTYSTEYTTNYTNFDITMCILPTFNIIDKLKIGIGPHYTILVGKKSLEISNYYETDQSGTKKLIRSTEQEFGTPSNIPFSDRSYFGLKAFITYQAFDFMAVGINYQYSRQLKYYQIDYQPYYNIFNLTTNFYILKSKK